MSAKTILVGLNEINFDFLEHYFEQGKLPHFKALFAKGHRIETISEKEHHLLEPWIQWVTVHTGQPYADHKVFRLGDISENQHLSQLFEELEAEGKTVAAMSPFNAANKLKKASFFIPDPWTKTTVTGNSFIKKLYQAIHQAVNDNAQEKVSVSSILTLARAFFFYVPVANWPSYISNILNRKKPGTKAMILDSLLADVFMKLWKKHRPDFANLFLNSGAHIQHHYMFNSAAYQGPLSNPDWYCPEGYDPFIKVMTIYDKIIGRLLAVKDLRIIIATGLHQQPHEQLSYYYRLKNHTVFIDTFNLSGVVEILPRMARDFLINLSDEAAASKMADFMSALRSEHDNELIFEVDNRGKSLFIELIYPNELKPGMRLISDSSDYSYDNFDKQLAFVAIKNGEHNGIGYLLSNHKLTTAKQIPLTEVKEIIKQVVHA